ncbi:hypothetical protein BV22DRAFT_1032022 [Leucogyrophana mollusca]|uniref:Uncharacterized protein n=1 Tax=Leucogyrophana mollusca TaxID=85980 RepID=A0ACB8BR04_9AGAM|nr:hypothetical protein BV22DRAFT_1032022 [Leucogyrophana mollusca]
MSDKTARSHTHVSNRAKARETLERKAVYKSVLENPFRIQWPSIPINVQNLFLAHLTATFDGVSDYRRRRSTQALERRAKRHSQVKTALAPTGEGTTPSRNTEMDLTSGSCSFPEAQESAGHGESAISPRTLIDSEPEPQTSPLRHLTIGINEVTRGLEAQILRARQVVTVSEAPLPVVSNADDTPVTALVFVCRADVDPPLLVDHIPHLVAACNATCRNTSAPGGLTPVKLVLLPKGSEHSLAAALGLRRVAILAVHREAPLLLALQDLLASVPTVSAPWLVSPDASTPTQKQLVPTHIKQLRTTAPKDMKAAKEQRSKAKAAAKKKKLLTSATRGKREKITASMEPSSS